MNIDWKKLFSQLDIRQITLFAIGVVLVGIILLGATLILPVLIFAAAIGIIGFLIYLVYRFLSGK